MRNHDRATSASVLRHYATVERGRDKVKGLEALLEAWEQDGNAPVDYLRELKKKLHRARVALKVMGGIPES